MGRISSIVRGKESESPYVLSLTPDYTGEVLALLVIIATCIPKNIELSEIGVNSDGETTKRKFCLELGINGKTNYISNTFEHHLRYLLIYYHVFMTNNNCI